MDIIENWNLLNSRMSEENSELTTSLVMIHMGAFDDLRKSGHMLRVNDKKVSEWAATLEPRQRLDLAGDVGRSLIDAEGNLFSKNFSIRLADHFPNCIFIAMAAIIENLDGCLNVRFPDKKMAVCCKYETVTENADPLGKLLPLLEKCYPWIELTVEAQQTEPPASEPPRYIPKEKISLVFVAERLTKIDTMRTVFGGKMTTGTLQKGNVLNVVDSYGKVLCNEGMVLSIFADGKELDKVQQGQHVDELCLAVEIPSGEYPGIFLVNGDEMIASADEKKPDDEKCENKAESQATKTQETNKKPSFWSKLFK